MKCFLTPFFCACATVAAADEPVEFNRDIRPILTKHCTACHGGVKEAGGISFIMREGATREGESGQRPIVPGDPSTSDMLRRIRSTDPDEVMPKPKHGPPLSSPEAGLIERWIKQGAVWQNHWAYEPVKEPVSPKVSDETWPSSPLDRFILARLDQEKLKPSSAAPAAEWLRRANFDLTGVPPSPEELAAFLTEWTKDPKAARQQAADRLLASPRFGERWAAVWLDLARYSDTYGFEKDPHRNIWPFRDWVIRAFNADMPFDQFTIEQLAGDLMPDATADQRLATGFHRNTQCNTEGGTDDEEFRVAAVIDRVSTTWTTWQATTFGCVQCHSHPYDPIAHEEFYQFKAFFNSSLDCDQDDDFPRMKVAADPAKAEEASQLETSARSLRAELNEGGVSLAASTTDWKRFTADEFKPSHGKLLPQADGSIVSEGTLPAGCSHQVAGPAQPFTALRLHILPDSADPKKWPERGSLVTKFDVSLIDAAGAATPLPMKEVFADHLGDPHDPGPGGNVGGFPKLEGPRWFVFVPAVPVAPTPGARISISMKQGGQTTGNQATPVRKFSIDISTRPEWTALVNDPARAAIWQQLGEARNQYAAINGTLVPVMIERPAAGLRETRIFARGNRLSKDDAVKPGIPGIFKTGPWTKSMTRADMARWLVSNENPLTARVMSNRLWSELFGTGIVRTARGLRHLRRVAIPSGIVRSSRPPPARSSSLVAQGDAARVGAFLHLLPKPARIQRTRRSRSCKPPAGSRPAQPAQRGNGPRSGPCSRRFALCRKCSDRPSIHRSPPEYGVRFTAARNGRTPPVRTAIAAASIPIQKRTSGFPGFLTFDAPSRDLCSARRITSNTPVAGARHAERSRPHRGRAGPCRTHEITSPKISTARSSPSAS
jgi:hypothetical protein